VTAGGAKPLPSSGGLLDSRDGYLLGGIILLALSWTLNAWLLAVRWYDYRHPGRKEAQQLLHRKTD